jgi:hypothetical protein
VDSPFAPRELLSSPDFLWIPIIHCFVHLDADRSARMVHYSWEESWNDEYGYLWDHLFGNPPKKDPVSTGSSIAMCDGTGTNETAGPGIFLRPRYNESRRRQHSRR